MMMHKIIGRTAIVFLVGIVAASSGIAQQLKFSDPSKGVSSVQQLLVEQVQQLARSGELTEAFAILEQLFDQAEGTVVERASAQRAGTLTARVFYPLERWVGETSAQLLQEFPDEHQWYEQTIGTRALRAMQTQQIEMDTVRASVNADRFYAAAVGRELNLLLADLYLEHGWAMAAVQAVQRAEPALEFDLSILPENREGGYKPSGRLPWHLVWSQSSDSTKAHELLDEWVADISQRHAGSKANELAPVLRRLLHAASLDPVSLDYRSVKGWIEAVAERLPQSKRPEIYALLNHEQQWLELAEDSSRSLEIDTQQPVWSQPLLRFSALADENTASRPRLGESASATLAHHPVVYEGIVFVNELTRIVAYELSTGRPWPAVPAIPLYDRRLAPQSLIPKNRPLIGTPRGMLSAGEGCLYARMGSPITGRVDGRRLADGSSASFLIGLDLNKQGGMLRGFPLYLSGPEFVGAEFEGTPVAWGDLLLVAIAQRDNVGISRSVAAFDRFSGQLRWRSGTLATGVVEGSSKANLISHQLLTTAGGRLYYNTNLGAITCLDPQTGKIQWLTQYSRPDLTRQAYPSPNRYLYRDVTPCLVEAGLVYCAPRDCPEVFALDATNGDLVWATDNEQVADATQLVGLSEDCLVVSGDRIIWLDKRSGTAVARFGGATTPGVVNSLPAERGMGRGVIVGNMLYFPTSMEILVFAANQRRDKNQIVALDPPVLRRIPLGARGKDGGNLFGQAGILLYSSPTRLMAFD